MESCSNCIKEKECRGNDEYDYIIWYGCDKHISKD